MPLHSVHHPLLPPHTPSQSITSPSSCPYSCFDEFNIGAFKGFFAGSLWGLYSLQHNLRHPLPPSAPTASTPSSTSPRLMWSSPRLQLYAPMLVYPVKFAGLVGVYRMSMCAACHLSPSPSPLSPLWSAPLSAALAGFVVSAPQLNAGVSMRMMAGCGVLGTLVGAGQCALQAWPNGSAGGQGYAPELGRKER